MKMTDHLHLVASGIGGVDLTDSLDCNVFLFTDGARHICFDAGAGLDVDGLVAAIVAGGLDPRGLDTVFLTHGHADHTGGARELAARSGARVAAGRTTATLLAGDDERRISLDRVRRFYPPDYRWTAPAVDVVVAAGETVAVGALSVTLVATPGHSADHVSYLVDGPFPRALVAGDALFADGRVMLQDIEDCSVAATIATVRVLANLDFDAFLPGHGRFSLRNGQRHVIAALVHADAGLAPPPL